MTLYEEIEAAIAPLDGWCTPDKARVLAILILSSHPSVCVEIGVHSGKSLLPQAMALRQNGDGVAFGIDPWSREAALEGMIEKANLQAWGNCPFEKMYANCVKAIDRYGLQDHCVLVRARAHVVADIFTKDSIGLLHLDGNHSPEPTMRETRAWFPKVNESGFIVVDDIAWTEGGEATVRPAVDWMLEQGCKVVDETIQNCWVLQKQGVGKNYPSISDTRSNARPTPMR